MNTHAAGWDLLVIGSGISGLSAAVAAATAGARVLVLERSVPEEFGGNTRWTESYFRMKSDTEVSDDFEELLISNAGYNLDPNIVQEVAGEYANWPSYVKAHGMPDPELISTLSALAGPTVQWLKSFGVRFDTLPTYFVTAARAASDAGGRRAAMIERCWRRRKRLALNSATGRRRPKWNAAWQAVRSA